MESSESMVAPTGLFNIQRSLPTDEQEQGDLLLNLSDAGFVQTFVPGQYFMTKDAEEFSEFDGHVRCREYTLPRYDEFSTPRGWIRGNK